MDYRNKPPSEETPFPKYGIAEQTPFHILHTRNKPPSIAEETHFPKNAIAEQTPFKFLDSRNKPPSEVVSKIHYQSVMRI
ncbi:hypothetical protein DPMN_187497 [Dreissena polymorpha]|uniref:Uncharacterized protein n=1 Tax=Dreissena polymorpha TaxID=45954 RepID=A0A9D4DP59_DREPO|nr:hypothetical protein DPMN_187497 [Dreissena polymorpha]